MIEVLEFIFQDFWHWLGSVIMIAIICNYCCPLKLFEPKN